MTHTQIATLHTRVQFQRPKFALSGGKKDALKFVAGLHCSQSHSHVLLKIFRALIYAYGTWQFGPPFTDLIGTWWRKPGTEFCYTKGLPVEVLVMAYLGLTSEFSPWICASRGVTITIEDEHPSSYALAIAPWMGLGQPTPPTLPWMIAKSISRSANPPPPHPTRISRHRSESCCFLIRFFRKFLGFEVASTVQLSGRRVGQPNPLRRLG